MAPAVATQRRLLTSQATELLFVATMPVSQAARAKIAARPGRMRLVNPPHFAAPTRRPRALEVYAPERLTFGPSSLLNDSAVALPLAERTRIGKRAYATAGAVARADRRWQIRSLGLSRLAGAHNADLAQGAVSQCRPFPRAARMGRFDEYWAPRESGALCSLCR